MSFSITRRTLVAALLALVLLVAGFFAARVASGTTSSQHSLPSLAAHDKHLDADGD